MKDGKLTVDVGPGFQLSPITKVRFQVVGAPVQITFEGDSNGHPQRIVAEDESGPEPKIFEYIETSTLTAADLAEYAGTYYSEELDTRYTLVVKDGKLILRRKKFDDAPLNPTLPESFRDPDLGELKFTRDSSKRVSGFELNAGRVRHLQFSKESR
jgi:hypothetical protein